MNIGILTFHRAYNYGAFLQCYSLQKELKKRFPDSTIEVIDYESANMARYYQTNFFNYLFGPQNSLNNKTVSDRLNHLKSRVYNALHGDFGIKSYYSNKKVMQHFDKCIGYLPLSKERLISDSYEESIKFIENLHYDMVVVGSDAVWNDTQTNIPNVFYLSPDIQTVKLSYAASCYGFDYKQKKNDDVFSLKDSLQSFFYIGVRDDETEKYVNTIDKTLTVHHNCDPSLLLDLDDLKVNLAKVKDKMERRGIRFDKPIVGVMGNNRIAKIAREVCGDDTQIVAVYYNNDYCNTALLDLSPLEWACIFRFFGVTFTSFFHGTIFSLKNGTPTVTIEQNYQYAKSHITKTKDLLNRLGLDYYVSEENQNKEYITSLYSKLTTNAQAETIAQGIAGEIQSAESFFTAIDAYIKEKNGNEL